MRKLSSKINKRLFGLIAYMATGVGLIISTAYNEANLYKIEILIIFVCFFSISLSDYFRKMGKNPEKKGFNKKKLYILICAFIGGTLTWFINHKMGYGPVIANGLIGAMAATFLPNDLAIITYTSSFVGMSSLAVLPSLSTVALGSLIVGLVILTTSEIYAGFGGKGGTSAALSTIIARTIIKIFT